MAPDCAKYQRPASAGRLFTATYHLDIVIRFIASVVAKFISSAGSAYGGRR